VIKIGCVCAIIQTHAKLPQQGETSSVVERYLRC